MIVKAPPLTEAAFMTQVTELAELRGWNWAHFRPAQTMRGWRTPVSGPLGAGWPDLVLTREKDRRLILVELKADGKNPDPRQERVLQHLAAVVPEVYLWRPIDWPSIEDTLR